MNLKTDVPGRGEDHPSRSNWLTILTLVMLGLLLLMAVYAFAKGRIELAINSAGSLYLDILFSIIVAGMAVFVAFQLLAEARLHREVVKALRESEERYRTLFERVPVGLYRTTPDGRIVDANPALVEMLGYPSKEKLLELNASQVYADPQDRERINALLEKTGVVSGYEICLNRYDGSSIWVEDTVRAVRDGQGKVLYYDGSLENITERKRAERYMLRAERLAAMGRISASLAHEVKNPLQAIRSNLELLLEFPLEADERDHCLHTCRQEVDRLISVAERVLTFARTEKSTVRPFSLPQVWEQVLTLLSEPLKRAGVTVTSDFIEDLPPAIGIADQITQVIINLALNAVEVMPNGGLLKGIARQEGNFVAFSLINDGPPIQAEHLERIFEPFFTTKPDGTGLGLFISYNIIQEHGGMLSVENLEGGGVAFKFTLPALETALEREKRE